MYFVLWFSVTYDFLVGDNPNQSIKVGWRLAGASYKQRFAFTSNVWQNTSNKVKKSEISVNN